MAALAISLESQKRLFQELGKLERGRRQLEKLPKEVREGSQREQGF
jgi:hypothetical protein